MRPPNQYSESVVANEAEEPDPRAVSMMIYTRLAGRAVIRVVGRCNEAKEHSNLDLSRCELMQVPDAVYHLMRHTELKSCDLSDNVITKIPAKFVVKFAFLKKLNLSHNQMAQLPDGFSDLSSLRRLDISHNSFISLPNCIFKIPNLKELNASNNHIVDVEVEYLKEAPSLESVDLTNNPLTRNSHSELEHLTKIRIILSPREIEDWEDLNV
ncbi:hypothetical protein WA026_011569 [Henosepilachna vigintioctopunctata]|uniref:Disease resistance R13L4/SHOC-2-like LRR domain-containing protein n=1 Tax=Henosepilachna vigintioctopunctata TaxID=420089 RepID=A0AAW1TLZ8_9CUCU